MNIRTHIQALLICTMALSAQAQSIVDSRASLPRAVQLHGDEGRETVHPDESKRISPNEAPASRMQPQRIVNRIAATVNGRPITANEVSVRLMPIGAQLAAQYPKQGPEFYKQLALAKKNIIEDLVERELLRNEFEGMGGVIRDSLIDQEINRTILTTFNGDRSAFLKNLNLSGMTIRAFREMTKKQLQVQIMRASKYDQEIPPTPEEIRHNSIDGCLYYSAFTPRVHAAHPKLCRSQLPAGGIGRLQILDTVIVSRSKAQGGLDAEIYSELQLQRGFLGRSVNPHAVFFHADGNKNDLHRIFFLRLAAAPRRRSQSRSGAQQKPGNNNALPVHPSSPCSGYPVVPRRRTGRTGYGRAP